MSVENKAGNTKFLLSQLMHSKDPLYQPVQMSRSYQQCCEVLGMDAEMITRAKEVDEILGIDAQGPQEQESIGSRHERQTECDY
jgi:tRNA-dihydrouridine synthase 2